MGALEACIIYRGSGEFQKDVGLTGAATVTVQRETLPITLDSQLGVKYLPPTHDADFDIGWEPKCFILCRRSSSSTYPYSPFSGSYEQKYNNLNSPFAPARHGLHTLATWINAQAHFRNSWRQRCVPEGSRFCHRLCRCNKSLLNCGGWHVAVDRQIWQDRPVIKR